MAWVLLESDKAAMAHALGAVPKCPPPHAFMKPTAKPKPRLPQPRQDVPGSAAAESGKKRKVLHDLLCWCTCKTRRWTDTACWCHFLWLVWGCGFRCLHRACIIAMNYSTRVLFSAQNTRVSLHGCLVASASIFCVLRNGFR